MQARNPRPRSNAKSRVIVTLCLVISFCASLVPSAHAQTPDTPRILPAKYINTYVSVIDPNIVEDIFGKRISDRFVAIQVTISNKNSDFQFLIHDVSLDLKNVFGKKVAKNVDVEAEARCEDCTNSCMRRTYPDSPKKETADDHEARFKDCRANCGSACRPGRIRFELSSLELSLIRGVAEKGQAQDKRNKLLRYLEGAGTIAAGAIGFAGPSYSDFMAIYNGEFLAGYRHIYPDFTLNQMNRLSDSAYKSNTLIPKEQARVIVAFIPQSIFLSAEQKKKFRKDPTSLYPNLNEENPNTDNTIDFRRAIAMVDGNFVTEIDNLPALVTGIHFDPEAQLGFLKSRPAVKGYILGQFLEGSQIVLVDPLEGMEIALDKTATAEEGKLSFVITANGPVDSATPLTIKVFNKQNSQMISQAISYSTPMPTLEPPAGPLENGIVGGPEVIITLHGKNLIPEITKLAITSDTGVASGITFTYRVENSEDKTGPIVATLNMTKAKEGTYNLTIRNGKRVATATVPFTVKPKPATP